MWWQPIRNDVTRYDEIDDLGYEIACPEQGELHHVIEPRYSHLTNGFTGALALARWLRHTVVGLSRGPFRWTSKTAVENLQLSAVLALAAAVVWLVWNAANSAQGVFLAPFPPVFIALIASGIGVLVLVTGTYALFLDAPVRAFISGVRAGDVLRALVAAHSAQASGLAVAFAIARIVIAIVFLSPLLTIAMLFGGPRTPSQVLQLLPFAAVLEVALAIVLARLLVFVLKRAAAIAEDVYTVGDLQHVPAVARRRADAMKAVARRVVGTLQLIDTETGNPYYDEVHLYGHSLGGIIGADVLAEVHRAVLAGIIGAQDAIRLKTLVTYGSGNEKILRTLRMPRIERKSSPYDTFRATVPLLFFDPGPGRLYDGRWYNVYYAFDTIAEHVTYGCCKNVRLRSPSLEPHTAYVRDSLFFDLVLDMITRDGLDEYDVREPLPARIASFARCNGLLVSSGLVRGSIMLAAFVGIWFAIASFAARHVQWTLVALTSFWPLVNALWVVADDRQDPVVIRKARR